MRKLLIPACLALCSVSWLTGCGIPRTACNTTCQDRHTSTNQDRTKNTRGVLTQKWTVVEQPGASAARPEQNSGNQTARKNTPTKSDEVVILNMASQEIPQGRSAQGNHAPALPMPSGREQPNVARTPVEMPIPADPVKLASSGTMGSLPPISSKESNDDPDGPLIINSNSEIKKQPSPAPVAQAPVPMQLPRLIDAETPKVKDVPVVASAPVNSVPTAADSARSLTGQVQEFRKTLRLRYADVDQFDAHGGCVVLEGGAELARLRDGQRVRVRGTLIPATERTASAHFRVEAIEVLE